MKSSLKYMALGLFALASSALTGCSDDNDVLSQLPSPEPAQTDQTIRSLTFNWEPVEHATQYGLQLLDDADEVVATEVTTATTMTFTKLEPATTYTLKVWAYGPYGGDFSTSPTYVLQATTPAIVTLDTPAPVVDTEASPMAASWAAIDNADFYVYTLVNITDGTIPAQDVKITNTTITLSGLTTGKYELSVYAGSNSEAYAQSATATVEFEQSRTVLWTINGTYYSCYYTRYHDTTLTAYSDGTYSIAAFYKYDGYDFEFIVTDEGSLQAVNPDAYIEDGWTYVPTGITGYDIPFWLSGSYSGFYGNRNSGEIWMYNGWSEDDDDVYDMFFWDLGAEEITVDDVVGTYSASISGWDLIQSSDWTEFNYNYDLTITKKDATTVYINDFFWSGFQLEAVLDPIERTLTMPYQQWGVYEFAYDNSDEYGYIAPGNEQALVATIADDGTITINNWAALYQNYTYTADTEATLTPVAASSNSKAAPWRKMARPKVSRRK